MPKLTSTVPSYCLHRPSGKAFVRLNGKQIYLGPWKSKASKLEYDRLIGEWLAGGRRLSGTASGSDLTVVELSAKYWAFAKRYYTKNGKPTGAQDATSIGRTQYGHSPRVTKDGAPRPMARDLYWPSCTGRPRQILGSRSALYLLQREGERATTQAETTQSPQHASKPRQSSWD